MNPSRELLAELRYALEMAETDPDATQRPLWAALAESVQQYLDHTDDATPTPDADQPSLWGDT